MIVRAVRAWPFWLALVLLAAHSLATWHPYAHSAAEVAGQVDGKHRIGLADCGFCLVATAAIGGAPPTLPVLRPRIAGHAPSALHAHAVQHASVRRPYTIRAPPVIAD